MVQIIHFYVNQFGDASPKSADVRYFCIALYWRRAVHAPGVAGSLCPLFQSLWTRYFATVWPPKDVTVGMRTKWFFGCILEIVRIRRSAQSIGLGHAHKCHWRNNTDHWSNIFRKPLLANEVFAFSRANFLAWGAQWAILTPLSVTSETLLSHIWAKEQEQYLLLTDLLKRPLL